MSTMLERSHDTGAIIRLSPSGEMSRPAVDVVIPVHNEQKTVAANVARLHAYLGATLPAPFRITVVDNASTDGTWREINDLHRGLDGVGAIRLEQKGRGRALRRAWSESDADVLAYMDLDLSTGLDAMLPLLAPLWSRHSDIAIGSRLARGARVVRGRKRDVISRCYNLILHSTLNARFSDAQCGFKAITRDAARLLVPMVADEEWFFDTELLVLAERAGLRIHEVPVDWIDDLDSRVDVIETARKDLQGVWRLRRSLPRQRRALADLGDSLVRARSS